MPSAYSFGCAFWSILILLSKPWTTFSQYQDPLDPLNAWVPPPLPPPRGHDSSPDIFPDAGVVVQSSECTPSEMEKKIQCFRERPHKSYEVPLGGTVVMNCVVAHLAGKVQWRAHEILLGYERSLPGWERFRYVGRESQNEYNLEIRNLTQKDQGEYECQVTPTNSQPLRRKKTDLIVLIKPSDPKILYRDKSLPDSKLVLFKPDQVARVELSCLSEGGSPAPTFQWLHNSLPMRADDSIIIENIGISRSRLSVRNNLLKDLDQVSCLVSNKATQLDPDPERRKLRSMISISVHRPPGPPQIIDYQESQVYREGQELTASCVAEPTGKPPGTLYWRWNLVGPAGQNVTEAVPSRFYTQQIARYRLINRLLVPTLRRRYHGARLVCEATHEIGNPQSTSVNVKVKYPPSNVTITNWPGTNRIDSSADQFSNRPPALQGRSPGDDLVVYARAGETRRLSCLTAPYFDKAVVKWVSLDPGGREREIQSQNRVITASDRVSLQQESFISVVIQRDDSGRYLECQALFDGQVVVRSKVRLDIVYPPDKPTISGYYNEKPIEEGTSIEMVCISDGGNPLPDLEWYRNGVKIVSQIMSTTGMQRTRKLNLTPSRNDNGAQYHCNASSPASEIGVSSESIRLNLLFPPSRLSVQNVGGGNWVAAGGKVSLLCEADSANPGARLLWRHYDCGIKRANPEDRGEEKCEFKELQGTPEHSLPGEFGGVRTRSRLQITTAWRYNTDLIECRSESLTPGDRSMTPAPARIRLNVTFPPQFDGVIASKSFQVDEGSSEEISVEPLANPPVARYTWLRDGDRITSPRITPRHGRLILEKVRLEDMTNYTLVAANDLGEARFTFFLNITYGPRLQGPPHVNKTVTSENAELECQAEANPATAATSFQWRRLTPPGGLEDISGDPLVQASPIKCNQGEWSGSFKYFAKCRSESAQFMTSALMIYGVTPDDMGEYRCTVANGVGRSVSKSVNLIVHSKPYLVQVPRYSKAAGQMGSRVTLTCFSRAEPPPQFQWFRGPNNLTLVHGDKFRLSTTPVRIGMYKGELQVVNLQQTDYGQYYCQASNNLGRSVLGIKMTATTRPDPPTRLRVLNATTESIKLAWNPNFNGGLQQSFQIRWKASTESNYKYQNADLDDSQLSVTYSLDGLTSGTEYSISVSSRNAINGMSSYTHVLKVTTAPAHRPSGESRVVNPDGAPSEDNALLIIVAACVFGFVLLVINILVITFFIKRRGGLCQRRPKTNNSAGYVKADTVEMYPRVNGCARGMPDDQKTYSSYDTASEDLKEDLLMKHNEFMQAGVLGNLLPMVGGASCGDQGISSQLAAAAAMAGLRHTGGAVSPLALLALQHPGSDQGSITAAAAFHQAHRGSGTSSPANSLHSQSTTLSGLPQTHPLACLTNNFLQQPGHLQLQQHQLAMAAYIHATSSADQTPTTSSFIHQGMGQHLGHLGSNQSGFHHPTTSINQPTSPVGPYHGQGPMTLTPISETGGPNQGNCINTESGQGSLSTFLPGSSGANVSGYSHHLMHPSSPPLTPQRCSPQLMTSSYHRQQHPQMLNPAELDLIMHNSYNNNDSSLFHDPNRLAYLNSFGADAHGTRHSYAEEVRRVQYGGAPPMAQFSYPGNSLPRGFSALGQHPLSPQHHQMHHRLFSPGNSSGHVSPSPADIFAAMSQHHQHQQQQQSSGSSTLQHLHQVAPPRPPERSVSRSSNDQIADHVIPPPKDFSPQTQHHNNLSQQQQQAPGTQQTSKENGNNYYQNVSQASSQGHNQSIGSPGVTYRSARNGGGSQGDGDHQTKMNGLPMQNGHDGPPGEHKTNGDESGAKLMAQEGCMV